MRKEAVDQMMTESFFVTELGNAGIPLLHNEPLSRHTTFKIGGPARYFCLPRSVHEIRQVIELCKQCGLRYYLLGHGSNILFADEGYDGVIVHIGDGFCDIDIDNSIVTAQAGAMLSRVCIAAQKAGLSGLEFAYGIPGCIGGAVYMNAGAYGGEMRDVLRSITYLDSNSEVCTTQAEELAFEYRTSIFERRKWCVLSAQLTLLPDDPAAIQARMEDYAKRRADKQPLNMPSAGSTFKRPDGAFAGALIEQCGLRGYTVGGAAISEKHCGFVVNLGGATCADVLALTEHVRKVVVEKTGFVLEREIRVVR